MAEATYAVISGVVQKFGDKEVVTEREVGDQTIREFTIRATGSQKLVKLTFWPEYGHIAIDKGYWVEAEGKFSQNVSKNGTTFLNLSVSTLNEAKPPISKADENFTPAAAEQAAPDLEAAPF